MIKNIFLVFFRKIRKNDIYSLINLAGLSIGITACLLIFLFVADEFRFDRHHEHAHDIYRLLEHNPNTGAASAIQPGVMYSYLEDQVPGVEKMGMFLFMPEVVINPADEPFTERDIILADPSMLDIFSFEFLAGDPARALENPHSMILTKETAQKYFADENPIGQTLLYDNYYSFVITAVVEPPPAQSHFNFSMIGAIDCLHSLNPSALNNWGNSGIYFYFKLTPGSDPAIVADAIQSVIWESNENFRDRRFFLLQPLLDIRLHSHHIQWDRAQTGNITVVLIFIVVAALILILACFNFVNLSVATAIGRAREIGVKKVLGVNRRQLILQFIAETFLIAFFAMLLALLLVEILLPALNNITGKSLSLALFSDPLIIVGLAVLLVVISLIAGGYPAMVMSRFKAVNAMKGAHVIGTIKAGQGKRYQFRMRQLLMLLQFAVSTALIVSSLMIFWQMRYLSNRSPGYEMEGLIAIKNPINQQGLSRALWLKEQLQQNTDVIGVSLSHNIPPVTPNNYSHFRYESEEGTQNMHGALISCDANFFHTLKSQILSGRDFSEDYATDATAATIINATAASRMGMEDPVGMTIQGFYDGNPRQIIGVVEDIHFSSLHETVGPMVFFINVDSYPQNWFNILVRYNSNSEAEVLRHLEGLWQQEAAEWPLRFSFVEEQFMEHYQDDRRMMIIMASFAGLAILLSVLGLLGLAVYAAVTRTREIGIRKVLGASVTDITRLITSEFGILVIVSNLLAWPAAWIFINRWLDNFAYRVDISWLIFLIPALMVYLIAVVTVGLIAVRAANMNPVTTLQNAD